MARVACKNGPSEADETRALVQWLRVRGVRHFAVPNGAVLGGRNRYSVLGKLRAEGMLAGAPDLVLIDLATATGQPVALEMKRLKGGHLSQTQRNVIASMRRAGWIVIVARGALDAMTQLQLLGY